MKGAPETVLDVCDMSPEERDRWCETVRQLSSEAKKVIGCGWLETSDLPQTETKGGFHLAGLIAVTDPIREGVREAMAQAREAGIQVVMITGDHLETAAAIARSAGLAERVEPISGDRLETELAAMSDDDLHHLTVVGRATPAQKVLVVQALQRSGRLVVVTGDGVNDAPALRAADVGIAMGARGTRSAREVAQIVLMDDNFSSIVATVAEGRQLFQNLRMSFAFLLMVHIPLVATAAIVPLLGYPLLYLPVHIVWFELLIHPAAILGFQKPATGVLDRRRPGSLAFFDGREWVVVMLTGLGIAAGILAVFIIDTHAGNSAEHARSMALLALVSALATLLIVLARGGTRAAWIVASCALGSGLTLSLVDGLAVLMHLHHLSLRDIMAAVAIGAVPASAGALMSHRRHR